MVETADGEMVLVVEFCWSGEISGMLVSTIGPRSASLVFESGVMWEGTMGSGKGCGNGAKTILELFENQTYF